MIAEYECVNPACDHLTTVRFWPATRVDPAESTWSDGCSNCGWELEQEPSFDEADMREADELKRAGL
jgi:hypothetical protein